MKSDELRLGNWVMYNDVLTKIYSISLPLPSENKHFDNKEIVTLWCNGLIDATCDEIEPIKLTEQMLLDNGFVLNENGLFKGKDGINILRSGDDWEGVIFNKTSHCDFYRDKIYLHELQNLYYAVNKKELDFKF